MGSKRQTRVDAILNGPERTTNMQWWAASDEDAGRMVATVVWHIRQRTIWRREADDLHAVMYAGGPGAAGMNLSGGRTWRYMPATMPRNVCRQAVDTLCAKVAKHRPLPQCLTSRGNWKQQKRARKMTQFLEGCFYGAQVYEKHAPTWVRDAGVYGRGILKAFRTGKKIRVERVHPWELLTDDWDARYGEPRCLYHVRTIDVGVALAEYGDTEELQEAILTSAGAAPNDEWEWQGETDSTVNRVRVVEAWHLCDDEEAHSDTKPVEHHCTGRHVTSILGGCTLDSKEWGETQFPFAILNYSEPLAGYWGIGVAEMLEGWQLAINDQFEKVQEGHHMLGGGIIFNPIGSDTPDTSFHNGGIAIVNHNPGLKPTFETPAPINPAVYQRERDMPQDALGEIGLSMMSTQGMKAPGINSGVAINAMDDIEDERHVVFGRRYEAANLQLARLFIRLAAQIAEDCGELAVQVPMKTGLLKLKWSEVSLNDFQLRVFPTSMLPQQLGARLEKLKMLFDAQLIDKQTFMQQLDAPDMSAEMDLETADRLAIDESLEAICDAEGQKEVEVAAEQATPSAYIDYHWGQKRAQQRVNMGRVEGIEEINLDALRQYAAMCQTLIDEEAGKTPDMMGAATGVADPLGAAPPQGMAPPPGMPPMPPPGMPGPEMMPPPMPGGPPPMPMGVA